MSVIVLGIVTGVVIFQVVTAREYMSNVVWAIPALIVLAVGGILLITRRKMPRYATVGFVCVMVAMMWVPTSWAAMTTLYTNASSTLPEAYSGSSNAMQGNFGRDDGSNGPNQGGVSAEMLNYLEANTTNVKYLVAVSSSMQGAPLVLATGRPVLYMGGFSGSDPVVNAASLAKLVSDHELRYVLAGGGGGAPGNSKSDVTSYLQSSCKAVNFNSTSQSGNGFGFQATTLYDCGA
jgi:4-amino-4-deoxy-L-arabinose transferase-like glycosyltransferase